MGNGIFGIGANDTIIPLQARMMPHALCYFDDPYFVCRVRSGGPDEQWCSILTMENAYGAGTYEWRAKAANPGRFRQQWLGGFERRHGFPIEGMIGFWIYQGTYKVVSYWDGVGKETVLSSQDWTAERIFKIVWSQEAVRFYVDGVAVAVHTQGIPQGPMNFFFEAGRQGGTTKDDAFVFLRRDSFSKLA